MRLWRRRGSRAGASDPCTTHGSGSHTELCCTDSSSASCCSTGAEDSGRRASGGTGQHRARVPMSLLEVKGLTVRFGGLVALDRVDVAVDGGETLGVIGPNGSGKTTLFNALTGLYAAVSGEIKFLE